MSISRCKETKMLKNVQFLVDTLSADSREEGGGKGRVGEDSGGGEELPHARRASSCIIISQ